MLRLQISNLDAVKKKIPGLFITIKLSSEEANRRKLKGRRQKFLL